MPTWRGRLRMDVRIWQCTCILVFLLVLTECSFDSEKPSINTKWGLIRGKWSRSLRHRPIANFLGIPYALPPVGELRFENPQRWNRTWTIRNATTDADMCIQISKVTSELIGREDCLYLNVYVPYISDERRQCKKLPILAYVYGGGFSRGSADSDLYAPDYILNQDIILVTINYRLSVLGFFSTTTQVSPGNYGLKDVKMALEWIQENIYCFGGNPKLVTLMGHSAGSAIVHFLALSKKTEGLFHRYILQSASASVIRVIRPRRRYRQTCMKLAELVGCQSKKDDNLITLNETIIENAKGDVKTNAYDISYSDDTKDEEIMACLRTIDAGKLILTTQYFNIRRGYATVVFGPTLEDNSEEAIITMHPLKILKNGLFRDIPVMTQVVLDEGLEFTLPLIQNPEIMNELMENFEEYLPYFIGFYEINVNNSALASAIEDFYFNGNVTLGISHNITKMSSDIEIVWPMYQTLQYQSKLGNSSIYFSYFTYEGTFSHTFLSGSPKHYGVAHGDDLNYIFPICNNMFRYMLLNNTLNDIIMINIMTETLANFVINGIPKASYIPEWPEYRDHHEFMRFGIDGLPSAVVQTDFLPDRMEFCEKMFKVLVEPKIENIFSKPEEDIHINNNNNNAMNCRLLHTIPFALSVIIHFYM